MTMPFDFRRRDKNREISRVPMQTDAMSADFFQKEARQCRVQAQQASNEADRESWLEMAKRWEGVLHLHHGDGDGRDLYRDRLGRKRYRMGWSVED
jgi:hypothetical protein